MGCENSQMGSYEHIHTPQPGEEKIQHVEPAFTKKTSIKMVFQKSLDHPIRIRKSLAALKDLKDNDERKGYFYCLKMLGILPPPPGSGFDKWIFKTPASQYSNYVPKCLHDVLIASHATSCEHSNIYFSFYHRHLMILTEIFLNFAHKILRGGLQKLKLIYKSEEYTWLYSGTNQKLWIDVCETYKTFKGIPDQIANHYWAPTDYQQNLDMTIPEQLTYKQISNDPIDALYFSINNSYPWEINAPRRWYNKETDYKKQDLPFYHTTPVTYSDEQRKLIAGNLDPRSPPQNRNIYKVTTERNGQQISFLDNYFQKTFDSIQYRIYSKFDDSKKNFLLNAITVDESLANYGARSKNLQYITKQQKNEYKLTDELVQNFNMTFPHYQYAYALFAYNMKNFVQGTGYKGVQRSHNTMHNNFGYIMQDASYSVTTLLFYTYHSWIDAMIQFKIRRATPEDYDYFKTTLNQKYGKIPTSVRSKLVPVFNQISAEMSPLTDWHLSGNDVISQGSGGIYPILEWVSPTFKTDPGQISFSPAFCSRDLILTKTGVRNSFNFNQIYQSQEYVQLHKARYAFFEDLGEFNYNFNYQIGSSADEINNLLDQTAKNIPSYLQKMEKDILQKVKKPVLKSIKKPKQKPQPRGKKQIPHKTNDNEGEVQKKQQTPPSKQKQAQIVEDDDDDQFEEQNIIDDKKILQNGIPLFASYPPNTKNGNNAVYVKLKNIQHINSKLSEQLLQDLQRYAKHGLKLNDISIFGKQEASENCFKCQNNKEAFINLDQDLKHRVSHIWQYIHLDCLNQVLFDSHNPNQKLKLIQDRLTLVPNSIYSCYRIVSGAQELFIKVKSTIKTKQPKFIRLDSECYSVRSDTVKMIPSKKYSTFNASFDFFKIFDVDSENQYNSFDHYVYKKLRGCISVGKQRIKFSIMIPNYQRILRLTLLIEKVNGELHVRLIDSDFQVKKKYYELGKDQQ